MIELKCVRCGSNRLVEENGRYTCQYCGGQFVFEPKDSLPNVVEKMQDDMVDALNSLEYDEAEAYSQRLLSIDPESGMAWTVAGLIEIGKYKPTKMLKDYWRILRKLWNMLKVMTTIILWKL